MVNNKFQNAYYKINSSYWTVVSILLAFLIIVGVINNVNYRIYLLSSLNSIIILLPLKKWLAKGNKNVPLFELLCLYCFLSYCLPSFLAPIHFVGWRHDIIFSNDETIRALLVIFWGFLSMVLAYLFFPIKLKLNLPSFILNNKKLISISLVYLFLSCLFIFSVNLLPVSLRKVGSILTTTNCCLVIYTLTLALKQNQLNSIQVTMYKIGIFTLSMLSIASGWLQEFIYIIIFFYMAHLQVSSKLYLKRTIFAICLIVLLNNAKQEYREKYWAGNMGHSYSISDSFAMAKDWISLAFQSKTDSVTVGGVAGAKLVNRLSNLPFLTHVINSTPKNYSHTGLWSYSYIIPMIIPRILYPDKPTIMELQDKITMRYEFLGAHQRNKVALDVGIMTESYMAGGIAYTIVVLSLFGIILKFLTSTLTIQKGYGWTLIGLALLRNGGIMFNWTFSAYFAGMWQTMLIITFMYIFCRSKTQQIA